MDSRCGIAADQGENHTGGELEPAAVYLNGVAVADLEANAALKAGNNPVLLRYDAPGRGHFVLADSTAPTPKIPVPKSRTPLSMTWYDRPGVLPLDALPAVVSPPQVGSRVILDLGSVVATAEVRVNGQSAGIRVAPPWQFDITEFVKVGENRLEILVYNTLANHYRTVPTRFWGNSQSGLMGPVRLEFLREVTLSE